MNIYIWLLGIFSFGLVASLAGHNDTLTLVFSSLAIACIVASEQRKKGESK